MLVYPNCAYKLSTQFKAPYTSSECKILYDIISEPLTFAGNSAFWGAVWGPVRILHPLWQGKGAFLMLPRSTSASGYKIKNVVFQCCRVKFGAGVLGKPASGRHSHKGHRGKRQKSVALYLLRVSSRFFLSAWRTNYMTLTKLNGVNRWPDGFWHIASHLTLGRFFQQCLPIQSMTPNSHQSCGKETMIYEF